jgi:uncharacterized membrane protein (UPF0127 family)
MGGVLRLAWLGLVAVSLVSGWTVPSSHAQQPAPPAVSFEKSSLVIDTAGGPLTFEVELALTPEQQQRGLMFRQKLGAKEGMLFDFGSPQPLSFWMANTLIPLDMLFIDGAGRIVRIHANAEPLSTRAITSGAPARAVLEINGGASRLLGIKPGDVVRHAIFGNGK